MGFSGEYVKEYIEASNPTFTIGEYWDSLVYEGGDLCYNHDAHRQRVNNWINATGEFLHKSNEKAHNCNSYCTLQGILHSALHSQYWMIIDPNGKPTGVMGWWPSCAVTFVENHDTGSTQVHSKFSRLGQYIPFNYMTTLNVRILVKEVLYIFCFGTRSLAVPTR
ncbi:putative alpha-amylase [Helianthus anomalus]